MDEAILKRIYKIRNENPNVNIIRLTEVIFNKIQDFCIGEIVETENNFRAQIINKINDFEYQILMLNNGERIMAHKTRLKRLFHITRNEIRKVLLQAPKTNTNSGLPSNININFNQRKPNVPNNIQKTQNNIQKTQNNIQKTQNNIQNTYENSYSVKKTEAPIYIGKNIQNIQKQTPHVFKLPECLDFNFTFFENFDEKFKKIYLKVFTFFDIYDDFLKIEKMEFHSFNEILLDFKMGVPLLSKICKSLVNEKKVRRRKFYSIFDLLETHFFKDFQEEELIKRQKMTWFTKKLTTSNFADFIYNFQRDVTNETEFKNILNLKNLSKNLLPGYKKMLSDEEFLKSKNLDVQFYEKKILKENEDFEGVNYSFDEIKDLVKNRLLIFYYFIEIFGETGDVKILNDSIGSIYRESLKEKNILRNEIKTLTIEIDAGILSESNDLIAERMQKENQLEEVLYKRFYARHSPFIGSYFGFTFMHLSKLILIQKNEKVKVLPKENMIELFKELSQDKNIMRYEKTRNFMENVDFLIKIC